MATNRGSVVATTRRAGLTSEGPVGVGQPLGPVHEVLVDPPDQQAEGGAGAELGDELGGQRRIGRGDGPAQRVADHPSQVPLDGAATRATAEGAVDVRPTLPAPDPAKIDANHASDAFVADIHNQYLLTPLTTDRSTKTARHRAQYS